MSNDTNTDNHPETPLTAPQARRHPSRRMARSPWRAKAKPSSGSPRAPSRLGNPPVRNLFAGNDHQNEKGSPQLQTDDQTNKNPRTQRTGGGGAQANRRYRTRTCDLTGVIQLPNSAETTGRPVRYELYHQPAPMASSSEEWRLGASYRGSLAEIR